MGKKSLRKRVREALKLYCENNYIVSEDEAYDMLYSDWGYKYPEFDQVFTDFWNTTVFHQWTYWVGDSSEDDHECRNSLLWVDHE